MTPNTTPDDVNSFHLASDRDSSRNAQHHTLGIGPYQAAAGNHRHDGKDSVRLDFNDILNSWMNIDGGTPSTVYTPIPHLDGGGI
jgi:hypothetical protein